MNKYLIIMLVALASLQACTEKFIDTSGDEAAARKEYLDANLIDASYKTASGLYYIPILSNPTGRLVSDQKYLKLIFSTWLTNGKRVIKANTMYHRMGDTISVSDRNVIVGLTEGLGKMRQGEIAKFVIPSDLAYGALNYNGIPPYSTLIYQVEVVSADMLGDENDAIESYLVSNPELKFQTSGVYFNKTLTQPDTDPSDPLTVPVSGDIVSVSYTGYYLTGNIFDKSSDLSVTIDSDGVVAGFEAAVKQLKVGEKCTVLIPSPYAYGIAGSGSIPPFTPIIFDITRND